MRSRRDVIQVPGRGCNLTKELKYFFHCDYKKVRYVGPDESR